MAKKPATREELLAQLESLDNSTEVAKLTAEVARLTGEVSSITFQRASLEKQVRQFEKDMNTIREALRGSDVRSRTHGANSPRADIAEAGNLATRLSLTHVRLGIDKGTHDPATGLEFTVDTKPVRDLSAGAPKVTKGELERIFPGLSGPNVDVTDNADALLDADLSEFTSALAIAQG